MATQIMLNPGFQLRLRARASDEKQLGKGESYSLTEVLSELKVVLGLLGRLRNYFRGSLTSSSCA
jgi:hypothetical protein